MKLVELSMGKGEQVAWLWLSENNPDAPKPGITRARKDGSMFLEKDVRAW